MSDDDAARVFEEAYHGLVYDLLSATGEMDRCDHAFLLRVGRVVVEALRAGWVDSTGLGTAVEDLRSTLADES